MKQLFIVATLVVTASCTSHGSDNTAPVGFCTAPRPIAITVAVSDAITGLPIADSAIGTARLGTTVDTLEHENSLTLLGGQLLGTYDVTVQRPGYSGWTQSGVAVTQTGPCGNVEPVNLTAPLQPLP